MNRQPGPTMLAYAAEVLSLHVFQVQDAIRLGVLDAAALDDRDSADQIAARIDYETLWSTVGNRDDHAKLGTALTLQRLRPDVMFSADTVVGLAEAGHIIVSGSYRGEDVYSAESVEAFANRVGSDRIIAEIAASREKVTRNESAALLGCTITAIQRLIQEGKLTPASDQTTARHSRPLGPLFMLSDVLALPRERGCRPEIRGFGPTTRLDERLASTNAGDERQAS